MSEKITLLTQENRELFEPCIMADIWQHMGDNDIFGYGIAKDNHAAGAIVCSYENDVVNFLSLGVSPDHRRQGLARWLLAHLEKVCGLNNLDEIRVRYFMEAEACVPLEALLTSCGYSFVDGEFKQITFTLGDLKGSRVEKQLQKTQTAEAMGKLMRFGELTQTQQQWLLEQVSIQSEEAGTLSPKRSCVSMRDEQIIGAALISEEPGALEIVQLHSVAGDETASMLCLFATMGEALATLPPDTMVRFRAVEDIADSLVAKLLVDCKIKIIQERIAYRSVAVVDAVTEQE